MDFSTAKSITIPEGKVKRILSGSTVLWQVQTGRIPSEYQEVEWVQAGNGVGAYINLGLKFDTAARINIGLSLGTKVDTAAYPFGAAESSGKYRCMISAPHDGGAYAYAYGSTGSAYLPVRIAMVANSLNEMEYVNKAGKLSLTNKTNGSSVQDNKNIAFTMTSNLLLFAQNYNGSARYGGERQIHYFKYYDKTDSLICDLVPCYRKSDGVIGMYDIVRKIFLTNAGTGSFTKGADV
jgi:hypothetical protein